MTTGVSVRALASPGFALALVVLVLNDHVLKQAYPGWVTGKLSDVAGLVFAPVLLGVLLTAWRVPRPMPVAIGLVGLGFTFAKTTATGAAVASAIWSLTGVPTLIRADVTDLLALPALYGAWLIHGQVSERARGDWRSSVARTIGVAMVPVTAVATAATSCDDSSIRLTDLTVAQGDFAGPPHEFGDAHPVLLEQVPRLSGGNAAVVSRYDESRRTYPNDDPSAGHRRVRRRGNLLARGRRRLLAGPGLRRRGPYLADGVHAAGDRGRPSVGGSRERVRRSRPRGATSATWRSWGPATGLSSPWPPTRPVCSSDPPRRAGTC